LDNKKVIQVVIHRQIADQRQKEVGHQGLGERVAGGPHEVCRLRVTANSTSADRFGWNTFGKNNQAAKDIATSVVAIEPECGGT
jgi:hypothetical protein